MNRYLVCVALASTLAVTQRISTDDLRIGGTGAALGTMRLLAEQFMDEHPGTDVIVLPSLGTTGGIRALAAGAIDLAVSSRDLKDPEREQGLQYAPYARSPLVPVVSQPVGMNGVTSAQVADIYFGKLDGWPDGGRVRPVMRPSSETDVQIIKTLSAEVANAMEVALAREGMLVGLNDQINVELLMTTSGAFGFATLAQILSERTQLRVLQLDGTIGSVQTLKNGSYRLFRDFGFVTRQDASPMTLEFIAVARSAAGRKVLEDNGSVLSAAD